VRVERLKVNGVISGGVLSALIIVAIQNETKIDALAIVV
jgi:hypothetical protein